MTQLTLVVRARVRAAIEVSGLTQREIGSHLGLSQAQVWHRVHGRVEWRTSELELLADLLGQPVSRFFTRPRAAN